MTTPFKASDHCLLSILLERSNEDSEDDRAGITELLAAMDELTSGWLVPLGVSYLVVNCDPANYFEEAEPPARPHHFLRAEAVPSGVRANPAFPDPLLETIPEINPAVLREAVTRGLDQRPPPGLVTSISELWWTSVRARAPVEEAVELVMPWPASTVSEILEGVRWCFGPTALAAVGPPARLRATNSHFGTELLLEVFWDVWRDFPPGRALVDAGVARVLARPGWQSRQLYPSRGT